MQTGVAIMMHYDAHATDPKHLRVGINASLVETAAIAKVLVRAGIITYPAYLAALCQEMEQERDKYVTEIESHTGRKVTLL
jgi:hypothetical protein